MSYWGEGIEDCDYAFGAVGSSISWIKERLFKDGDTVVAKSHPEQGLLASLCCLRMIGERFPKNLSVHFGKKDLDRARQIFDRWYTIMEKKLEPSLLEALKFAADREFSLFQALIEGMSTRT